MNNQLSRREFLQISAAAAAVPLAAESASTPPAARGPFRGTLCFFSKPVPQLNWRELAVAAKQAGFGGIDLTVRSHGHVLPERAATDLPRAVAAIRDAGLEVPMITTELLSADDPTAEPILSTASKLSIHYVKPGYYRYRFVNVLEELNAAGQKFRGLVALAAKHGIQVGYHNHPNYIGEAIWDMFRVIQPLDPRWCGFYFDLCQATMEGGESGWKVSGNLVMPRLKMIAAKDFIWKQTGSHRWEAVVVPTGQGMSRWHEYLRSVAQAGFQGPISFQQEFEIPGVSARSGIALSRATVPKVMDAAKQNLEYLKSAVHEAYANT